jgi:hypothetical protein
VVVVVAVEARLAVAVEDHMGEAAASSWHSVAPSR